jgi:hypothetical protein
LATFRDLRRYVTNDGWIEEPKLARGRNRTGDHRRCARSLPDGTLLRTKVPHDEQAEIGRDLFHRILRDQLRASEDRFWDVVNGTAMPAREEAQATVEPVPGWLVTRLLFTVGLSESDVARMAEGEARAAWLEYQARPRPADSKE